MLAFWAGAGFYLFQCWGFYVFCEAESGFYWGSADGHSRPLGRVVCDCATEGNVTSGWGKRGVYEEVDCGNPLAACHETEEEMRKESASVSWLEGESVNGTSTVEEANADGAEAVSVKASGHPAEASGSDARVVCGSGKGSESYVRWSGRASAVCGEAGNEVVEIGK
ncbi:hypothetical protein C8Q70DRAFT_933241 [Cubamyces menziesii]|nr:hypothetical protein C8Q70DRAFT_933241 [Cubamyces menziesii]